MNTMSCEKHLGMGTVQNCAPCLQVELDYVRSEIEALRADVVWAFEKGAVRRRHFHLHRIEWLERPSPHGFRAMQFDGTDADILRAVREARTK